MVLVRPGADLYGGDVLLIPQVHPVHMLLLLIGCNRALQSCFTNRRLVGMQPCFNALDAGMLVNL
jgi:hypothetical protein